MQEGPVGPAVVVGGLAAGDGQQVLLDLDVELVGAEAGDRDLDPVGVLAGRFDVVGRPAVLLTGARCAFQQAGQTVELVFPDREEPVVYEVARSGRTLPDGDVCVYLAQV